MKQFVTQAIVLTRTDYGEADRILTVLTPEHGKLRLLAKGVRRVKSKLAGGIELFSVSEITYIPGRGELGTLVSTRLITHYSHIPQHLDRTMAGYDLIKRLHKIIEDQADASYFALLQGTFIALDHASIPLSVVQVWFMAQILCLNGHTPNLQTTITGAPLRLDSIYDFDVTHMAFVPRSAGNFTASHIKFLRLAFRRDVSTHILGRIQGAEPLSRACLSLLESIQRHV